jgi:cardiolipin synthase A/B
MLDYALSEQEALTHSKNMNAGKSQLQFFSRTGDAWHTMYEDCLKAEKSIEFEQYIIRDDEIGRKFMEMFRDKAKNGILIRLLLDRVGSRSLFHSRLVQDILEQGGAVNFYNPIGWLNLFTPATWFPRNHTKTMLIDSKICHIGSACLADYMVDWRDQHARITGPLVTEIEKDFSYIWKRSGNKQADRPDIFTCDDPDFNYIVAKPRLTPSPIYRELLKQIRQAKRNIHMCTPYFLPPYGLRRALQQAADRGVDIQVIYSDYTDVQFAVHTSRTYFPRFLYEGIRLFAYKATVYHAKYTIIDGNWATMGSVNLDYLSLLRNREANIVMIDPDAVQKLEKQFQKDLADCEEILPGFWQHVPFRFKMIGYIGRLFKRML